MEEAKGGLAAYFPRAEDPTNSLDIELPDRPVNVELYDPELVCQPLARYDQRIHDVNYTSRPPGQDADLPPSKPKSFSDPYLMPSLTVHERLRLTLLWYHARDLVQDTPFMAGLQEKLNLVHLLTGWEIAILGLLSEDVYLSLIHI